MTQHPFLDEAFAIAEEALGTGKTKEVTDLAIKITALVKRSVPAHSEALDEIYLLRGLFAYETLALEAHTEYATFPKSRRAVAANSLERMRQAAAGQVAQATVGVNVKQMLRIAEVPTTLTASSYAAEKGVTA